MSMRTTTLLKNLFMMLAAAFIVGCDKEPAPEPKPDDPTPESTLNVEVGKITDNSVEFIITSSNVEKVQYVALESVDPTPERDVILTIGSEAAINTSAKVLIEDLNADTEHTIYVVATSGQNYLETQQSAKTKEATVYDPADVHITEGTITDTTATFTITSENAEEVKYIVKRQDEGYPTAEEWEANGIAVEPNVEHTITVEGLEAVTEYIFAAIATGKGLGEEMYMPFTTAATPSITATLTEDIGYDYAVFNVMAENVAEVKYVCIKAGSRDVTAEQVLKNGTAVESGDVKIEGLNEVTEYEVYVAAKGLNEVVIMADVLTFTTEKNIIVYTLTEGLKVSSYSYSGKNFFLTFLDEKQGYTLYADFYTTEELGYLTSGEYALGSMEGGNISSAYTRFLFTLTDITGSTFSSGSLNVVATPNEETREVYYEISGELYFSDGNYVTVNYSGLIDGIELPEIVEGAPEGAHIFEVKETISPARYTSSTVPGEYYIKFTDVDGGEFRFDLLLDPAICNNGEDLLPTGTYTTELFDLSYTDFVTYRPSYKVWSFTEIEVDVVLEGTTHTITVNATMNNGSETKPFYLNWSGEIENK